MKKTVDKALLELPVPLGVCQGFREKCASNRKWVFTILWGLALTVAGVALGFALETSKTTSQIAEHAKAQDERITKTEKALEGTGEKLDLLILQQRQVIEELRKK